MRHRQRLSLLADHLHRACRASHSRHVMSGICRLLRVLEEVRTCDANRAQAFLWVLLRLNTILLCVKIFLDYFNDDLSEAHRMEIGLWLALYLPVPVMLLIDEVFYCLTAKQPTLMLLRVTTVCSALTAVAVITVKVVHLGMHVAGNPMDTKSVIVSVLFMLLVTIKKIIAVLTLSRLSERVKRGDLTFQSGELPTTVFIDRG